MNYLWCTSFILLVAIISIALSPWMKKGEKGVDLDEKKW